jgi:hypothetical protein
MAKTGQWAIALNCLFALMLATLNVSQINRYMSPHYIHPRCESEVYEEHK